MSFTLYLLPSASAFCLSPSFPILGFMKRWAVLAYLFLVLFTSESALAQSPYLSVRLVMDTAGMSDAQYVIHMKFCSLKKPSQLEDWFSFEESKVNFETLPVSGVECGNYTENGGGLEYLTGNPGLNPYNKYGYGNQKFAFETILIFRIADSSARKDSPMYIVFPVKYKSFVTGISFDKVPFQPGKVLYIEEAGIDHSSRLRLSASFKELKGVLIKDFRWKELL